MQHIKTNSSDIAQWYSLILDAQERSGIYLPKSIEHYIVMTLNTYTTKTSISTTIIAFDLLHALNDSSTLSLQKLREVGDQCLILSGLFPGRAIRRNLSQDYYENMGKEAYYNLSFAEKNTLENQDVFYQLFEHFSGLTKLLNQVRSDAR